MSRLVALLERHQTAFIERAKLRNLPDGILQNLLTCLRADSEPDQHALLIALDLAEEHDLALPITEVRRLLGLAGSKAASERLMSDAALTAGSVGTFTWEIGTDRLYGDTSFSLLFGIRLDETGAAPLADYLDAIHPDDRDATTAKIQKTVDEGGLYEAEYRIVTNGRERWVVARGRVDRDEQGRPLRFPGVLMDITDRKRAEEAERTARAVAEAERAKLHALFMQAPIGICITEGANHVFTFANPAARALVGDRELVGKPLFEALPEVREQGFAAILDRVLATGETFTASSRHVTQVRAGRQEEGWYDLLYAPKRNVDGAIDGILHCTFDVTSQVLARHNAERLHEQLRLTEEHQRRVLDTAGAGLIELNVRSGRVDADARARELLGIIDMGDLTLEGVLAAIPLADDRERTTSAIKAAMRGVDGGRCHVEVRMSADAGLSPRWIEGRGQVTFDSDGKATLLSGVLMDVTARKEAEREREHAQLQLSDLLEQLNEGFFSMTPDFRLIRVNHRYEEMARMSREKILGQVLWDMHPGSADPSRSYWQQLQRCMNERMSAEFLEYYPPLDLWTEIRAYPTADGGLSAFSRDVSAQKRVELALKASEERYRTLFESIDDAYCLIQLVVDEQGRTVDYLFLETNQKFAENTGLVHAVGKTIRQLVPGISESWFEIYGRVAKTGQVERFENHDPALNRWFDAFANRVGPADQRQVAIVFKDITARRRAENERAAALTREQDARSEADAQRQVQHDLFMQAPVGIAILDGPDHVYTFANAPYRALVDDVEILNQPLQAAQPHVEGEAFGDLLTRVRRTGIPFVAKELPLKRQRDGEVLYINLTCTPKRNIRGEIDGVMVTQVDVTELVLARKGAEESSRLKDDFLATISHELRTPLTAMLGWVVMLRSGKIAPERQPAALEVIERNGRAQAQLVEDLLDMSRILAGKMTLEPQRIALASVVDSALESIRPAANSKGVAVQSAVAPALDLMADPERLQQVIWNLLTNAVKFTPKGGRVMITAQLVETSIELSVVDTGQGIPRAFLPFVFERFRQAEGGTTRTQGGLGLGLSIVKQLVEMQGGSVAAASEGEGKGSTFVLRFPAAEAHFQPTMITQVTAPSADLSGIRLLVVEDDDDSREMLRVLLESTGASVSTANSAKDARASFSLEPPDLVISDIGMPEENGYAFISWIRALSGDAGRDVPAIALTAYARGGDRAQALKAGFDRHIAKPVQPNELVASIVTLARRGRTRAG